MSEEQQQQPTMDPTLAQIMQTLVSNNAALQRMQQNAVHLTELLEKCRVLLEEKDIPLPEGMLPSDKKKKKKPTKEAKAPAKKPPRSKR